MIRVHRGAEPATLREARWWRLARAWVAHEAGEPIVFDDYNTDDVRALLYARQHEKCAYCEMQVQNTGQPVEHFRPKKYAVRAVEGEGDRDDDRYWWLAWTWENLFFACVSCNSPGRKGNRFPLAPGAAPCATGVAAEGPPGVPLDERAQLVDPSREDPIDAIVFVEEGDDWKPTGRAGDRRGRDTVAMLHLDDRDALLGKYRHHVDVTMAPYLDAVDAAFDIEDGEALSLAWRRLVASMLLNRRSVFRALSYDVIAARYDEATRAEHDLPLPRPGRATEESTPSVDCEAPHLDGLPERARWLVRAIGPPNSNGRSTARAAAVEALCAHTPQTVETLAGYITCTSTVVRAALGGLIDSGRVSEDGGRYGAVE